jgi:hypothetical protein
MNWKPWIKGLMAAFIGGGANAVTVIIVDPINFNPLQGGAMKVLMVALVSGCISAALYLKASPLPNGGVKP